MFEQVLEHALPLFKVCVLPSTSVFERFLSEAKESYAQTVVEDSILFHSDFSRTCVRRDLVRPYPRAHRVRLKKRANSFRSHAPAQAFFHTIPNNSQQIRFEQKRPLRVNQKYARESMPLPAPSISGRYLRRKFSNTMSKELIVSVNGREKKIAIIENERVTEFYIERGEENQGIVGNIYKGRVMRVLPGMQSAFVDIGLERDAFLYVSDFFDEEEEFERIVMDKSKKGDAGEAARAAQEQIEQARIEREHRIEATHERKRRKLQPERYRN
ncbi:MAG: hypothetical protein DMF68_20860 [Acidobacteria bacterium]|nr:MAG: hypothetical protein DMF68_20860 [Acidobacteriota bacterium]